MATANLKVRSGNKITVSINGQEVGLVQSLRGSDDYSPEPASGIGDIHVQEYVPSTAKHTIAVSQMVLLTGALRTAIGSDAQFINGDDALKGMVFDIEMFEKGGASLRKYTGCSYASGDTDVSAHKIVVSNAQFNALDVVGTGL